MDMGMKIMDIEDSEVPKEMKALKGIEKEELKRYFFPSKPMSPWAEQILGEIVDGTFEQYSATDDDVQFIYVEAISDALRRVITDQVGQLGYRTNLSIKSGMRLDLKSLLFRRGKGYLVRGDGDRVRREDLKGKYILVSCFFAPAFWESSAWELSLASSELYNKMGDKFEMVIVPKMRQGWSQDQAAFNHFLSGFPPCCLAVPFRAESLRERIFNFLCDGSLCTILLLAPSGKVKLLTGFSGHRSDLVPCYGPVSKPFPFASKSKLKYLVAPSSLQEFLGSDFVFRRKMISETLWKEEKVWISELNSKLVGVCLYKNGDFIPYLRKIEEECRQSEGKELEIVVLFAPSVIYQDSQEFPDLLSTVLAKRNLTWWVAPYNYSASIIARRLFVGVEVVIFGPNGDFIEHRAQEVMKIYGIDGYPFTFNTIVQKILLEVKQVTLESFIKSESQAKFIHRDGENIVIYFDYPDCVQPFVYDAFLRFQSTIGTNATMLAYSLANGQNYEGYCYNGRNKRDRFEWCEDIDVSNTFFRRLFNGVFPTIVAFGKDGKICSLLAHRLPHGSGIQGDVEKEVSYILDSYLNKYRSEGYVEAKLW